MGKRSSQGLAFLIEERPVEAMEQLDVAARVVPLRSWFALTAAFLTIGALGAFACWYQVPLKVDGKGILLLKGSRGSDPLLQVTAPASGRLGKVAVAIGSNVREGDLLAEIDQKELADQVTSALADVDRLREEDARMSRLDEEESGSQAEAEREVVRALRRSLELDRSRLTSHRRIAASDKSLKDRRMLSDSDALKSKSEADELESTIAANEAHLHEITFTRLRDETVRRRDSLKRKLAVREAETRLSLLQARLQRDSRIVSPHSGKVVDVMITSYGAVERGTAAVLLRPVSTDPSDLEATVFVPAGPGKRIQVGDAVEVAPDTVRRQEHGFIRGEVRSISEIPCTDQAMLAELKHPALVANFVEKYRGQVLLSIHVALREVPDSHDEDDRAPLNRLEWSSSSGMYQRISSGTLCSTSIVVERRPLLALAMPWFKGLIGIN
ncbi:MAG: NHLP bacteriocin system secretion protein [Isosphaeraceae bacterium]